MRIYFSSALAFLVFATLGLAAESSTPSATSKSGTRPTPSTKESPKEAPKEAPKTKKTPKPAPDSSSSDKPAQTEDEKFTAARKAAYEDPRVAELRGKADAAKNEEAANRAMRSYLRALYGKMRTLEPSLEERINMTEAAALRAFPQ
jgi:type IV secretory pathway VirB10-like protein